MKEKWGRKRKARDDESPGVDAENGFEPLPRDSTKKGKGEKVGGEKEQERETKKPIRTPVRPTQLNMATSTASPANASLPTTPSLKIRLPRLQHFKYAATLPSAHIDTPTPR